MHRHPVAYERVIGYAAGDVHGEEAAALAAHVAACPECARVVDRYRTVGETARTDHLTTPPAAAVDGARLIFARFGPPPVRPSSADPLRRLVARLAFASNDSLAWGGVRGEGDSVHALFESDEAGATVDIQIEPLPGHGEPRWQVIGQVDMDEPPDRLPIALVPAGGIRPVAETEADGDGVFAVEAASGRHDLEIRLPSALLVVPDLDVG